jgi:predicted unusual protein kinase regulating ubiquinone biosynthesis (AarF/ABC1/UbiB family)
MATRDEFLKRLLAGGAALSTSGVGRLAHAAGLAARAATGFAFGRFRAREDGSVDARDLERIEALVRSLGELKGVPMKLGQIAAYVDESLPAELRDVLAALHTHAPAMAFDDVATTLREELGPRADVLLATMERLPIAAASIGQVHRARLPDGTEVAVKVQYHGIDAALRAELGAAEVAARAVSRLLPGTNAGAFVVEARDRFVAECDYRAEAEWQRQFARAWAGDQTIRVPQVHGDYSSGRVLTTTFAHGRRFDGWLADAPAQEARDRIGLALYRFYLGSLHRFGLFNADPHPGNYVVGDDGSLTMLDFGCARAYSGDRVRQFVALRDAVQSDDPRAMREAFVALGAADPARYGSEATVRELLHAFFAPVVTPGVHALAPITGTRLGKMLADKQTLMRLALPADLLFLFRIKFGLYAILARLGARADWAAVEESWSFEGPTTPALPSTTAC